MHGQAEYDELRVDWPWYPNGIHGQMAENFQRDDDEQFLYNPTTGSREHYSLLDPFHEKNTVNPADSLRRVSCVRQLAGEMNTETAEKLNNRRNRDKYFTTHFVVSSQCHICRKAGCSFYEPEDEQKGLQ